MVWVWVWMVARGVELRQGPGVVDQEWVVQVHRIQVPAGRAHLHPEGPLQVLRQGQGLLAARDLRQVGGAVVQTLSCL